MVIHNIFITSIVLCFGLIIGPFGISSRFQSYSYILFRKWFAMYYGSGIDVSFAGTSQGTTAEIFGYSHRYPQCTCSSIVIVCSLFSVNWNKICDLFSVRREERKSRKQPSTIRPLVHIVQF